MRAFSMIVLGIPTVAFAAWAVVCVIRGEWLTAVVALAIATFWGSAAATWAVLPTSVPFATADASGTTIRPDRRIDRLMLTCIIAGFVGLGCLGVLGSLGWLSLPIPANVKHPWAFTAPWAASSLVFAVAIAITIRRGGMAYARITPVGVTFAERFKTRAIGWADVVSVSNTAPDVPRATSPLVVAKSDGSTVMLMESALFGPRDALFKLVDYVWRNPGARAELVDGRAVARLLAY